MAIGLNAKFYWGAAGSTANTELDIVREVTTDLTADDIVSAYRNSRFKSHEAGQLDLTLSLAVKLVPTNPGFAALSAAAENGTPIAGLVRHAASGVGWDADWVVLTMSEPQPIDGVLEVNFGLAINNDTREPVRV